MSDTNEFCDNWVDAALCETSQSININATACSDTIQSYRYGYCQCHTPDGDPFQMWSACNHAEFTCSDICSRATQGCKNTAQQLDKVFVAGNIVSCNGAWLEPGLDTAESQLCDTENGFEICNDINHVTALGLGSHNCGHLSEPNTFYATKIATTRGILGCGNVGTYDELPVLRTTEHEPFSLSMERNSFRNFMNWKMDDITGTIADNVYKTDTTRGGVLCCKAKAELEVISFGAVFLQLIIFILIFSTVTICLIKLIGFIMDRWIIPNDQNTGCFRWCRTDRIINVFGLRVPMSMVAYRKLKKMRDVEKIKCKPFSEFQNDHGNDDIISESSGQCVICLEEYQMDSQVIWLNCAHHFHYDCGYKWLMEHEECPICRQYFKTAKDRHSVRLTKSMIEMREVNLQSDSV